MRETRPIMGMPVIIDIRDNSATKELIGRVFDYFIYVDETFSTYKETSQITKINRGILKKEQASADVKTIFSLAEKTKRETLGFFDIMNTKGEHDPSGIVKGWAIYNASAMLLKAGMKNFYVEAGGDIQVQGNNGKDNGWKLGIKNPFSKTEIIKTVLLKNNEGIATSGSYERGEHIYNPKDKNRVPSELASLTVIGPNIYEADRFATAAFAIGKKGIEFIEKMPGFEAYAVGKNKIATMTSNFQSYLYVQGN